MASASSGDPLSSAVVPAASAFAKRSAGDFFSAGRATWSGLVEVTTVGARGEVGAIAIAVGTGAGVAMGVGMGAGAASEVGVGVEVAGVNAANDEGGLRGGRRG